jgi:hypothetical protein
MDEHRRKQMKLQQDRMKTNRDDNEITHLPTSFNDEEERRIELKRSREQEEKREIAKLAEQMTVDKQKATDMRRQNELQIQLQIAYKQGDTQTVRKIERLLAPDEIKSSVKHPWA